MNNKTEVLKVKVTQQHIDTGSKGSCFDCPIAYALLAKLSKNKSDEQYLYRKVSIAKTIKLPWHFNVAQIPKDMVKWIVDFDKGIKVKPFDFTIEIKPNPEVPVITHTTLS